MVAVASRNSLGQCAEEIVVAAIGALALEGVV
jgi:hypothetical protein